jgi:hypothetical protein
MHKHHIIPKHAGGTDDPSNLVKLTVAEHAEAHRILFEQYGREEDRIAWRGLAGIIGHEEAVLEAAKLGSRNARRLKGKEHPYYGKKRPEHSAKMKGRKAVRSEQHTNNLNKRFTSEYLEKVSNSISRNWKVTFPNGEIHIIRNMAKFCKENDLNKSCMSSTGKSKGYSCKKII